MKSTFLTSCILLAGSLWVCEILNAQTVVTQGSWTQRQYPNQITQLQWSHPAMVHNEHIGDAVILKPLGQPKAVEEGKALPAKNVRKPGMFTTPRNNAATAVLQAGSVQLIAGNQSLQIIQAFDSGHIRGLRIQMPAGSVWYGGGERSLPMQRNGQRIPLYNNAHYGYELNAEELNYSVPFVLTPNGYGLLFDNPAKGYLDFGKTTAQVLEAAFVSGDVNVFVIPGRTPEEIVSSYSMLTGRQPLPPRWALGNFVSRFGYRSQQQTEDVVASMKKDQFPVDAVIIDIFWFGDSIKGTLGNLDWMNKSKWPNPTKMIADFKKQQVNTILVTEPFFLQGTKNFEASKPYLATDNAGKPFMLTDFYFGYGGLLDLFKPQSRQWFWQFYQKQNNNGIAGWWGDLGEPEKHPSALFHDLSAMGISRKVSADEVHNMYGHMWSKMLFENWRKDYPNKRLFYLNRAGYAGSQRYSVFPWTGDVSRTWNGFRAQLPNLQSMSLSGVPYVHSDAGGFTNVPDNDQELYVRWLQMAGFTPVFRPHGTAFGDLEPGVHNLPSEPTLKDEPYKSIARNTINLRYSLLPYLYTMAWQQTTKGKPLIRPMIWNGATDSTLLQATDQYLFGDAFLVAPVLEPGASMRKLYLPAGQWYNWHSLQATPGKQWVQEPVTLDKMPLYVKAGSFIPMWQAKSYQNTAAYSPTQALTIRHFPGNTGLASYLYDDDGANPNALSDTAAHQLLVWSNRAEKNTYIIAVEALNWPAGLQRKFMLELPAATVIANTQLSNCTVSINQEPGISFTTSEDGKWMTVPIIFTGKKSELVIAAK